jgi:hypothetical protein
METDGEIGGEMVDGWTRSTVDGPGDYVFFLESQGSHDSLAMSKSEWCVSILLTCTFSSC